LSNFPKDVDSNLKNSIKPRYLVLGSGSVGFALAKELRESNKMVIIVDKDEAKVETLREEGFETIAGDISDPELVNKIDLKNVVVILFLTSNNEANRKGLENFKTVVNPDVQLFSRASDIINKEKMENLGADYVFMPSKLIASSLSRSLERAESVHRGNRLARWLKGIRDKKLAIVIHDNPDPDAISSGLALKEIAKSLGVEANILYHGRIGHQENKAFVNLLGIDLGKIEGVMPSRERVPTEEYQPGDRIRAFTLSVDNALHGPEIILSRSHPDFVRKLFELEVSEIADKTVEIKAIAREAGYRTKIAVVSHDEKVDPVGACVGMRGMRVKNIVRELSGEKIDIIRWDPNVRQFVTNALAPAKLKNLVIDEARHSVKIIVDPDQLSLAIGKKGQNARLTAKLTGWNIEIEKEESAELGFEEKVKRAVEEMAAIPGIAREDAENLRRKTQNSEQNKRLILRVSAAPRQKRSSAQLRTRR